MTAQTEITEKVTHLHTQPVPLGQSEHGAVPLHEEVASELRLAWGEDGGQGQEMVAVVALPLQHLLAQLVVLLAGLVAVDVNQSPLAVGDEVMIFMEDVPQLAQDGLQTLGLKSNILIFS